MFDITQIQPVSAIISAVITASVSFLIAYFLVAKRKKLGIRVWPTEELTRALRGHNRVITVSVDGQPFLTLNRSVVEIRNAGNTNIEKFSFSIEIPNEHKGYVYDVVADNRDLYDAIKVSLNGAATYNPTLNIAVETFLNPKEEFKVVVFFDQDAAMCKVQCRVPDTAVSVKYGAPAFDYRHATWKAKATFVLLSAYVGLQVPIVLIVIGALLYEFVFKLVVFGRFFVNLH
jgi:hypothetical protein